MRLKWNEKKFKSIINLESVNIPNFTVITGINGSGKTQLLEAIESSGSIRNNQDKIVILLDENQKEINNSIYFHNDSFRFFADIDSKKVNKKFNNLDDYKIRDIIKKMDDEIEKMHDEIKKINNPISNFFGIKNPVDLRFIIYSKMINIIFDSENNVDYDFFKNEINKKELYAEDVINYCDEPDNEIPTVNDIIGFLKEIKVEKTYDIINECKKNIFDVEGIYLILLVAKKKKKKWAYVREEDFIFRKNYFGHKLINLCNEFLYQERLYILRNVSKAAKNLSNVTVDTAEYRKKNQPPWEFFNNVLLEYDCNNYRLNCANFNICLDSYEDLKLRDISLTNGTNFVRIDDLSSGEKVLLAFAYVLYENQSEIYPKILLLDEIDSSLHPSMVKKLIDVLKKNFINEYKMVIIMVTHSPTTIALCPESSVFELIKNEQSHILKKTTRDIAISRLLHGVPKLSINCETSKQIFVESEIDSKVYNYLYKALINGKKINDDVPLNFISSGISKKNSGNCAEVKKIVKILRDNGNKNIFGIVDKDSNEISKEEGIFTLKRYSIENYLLDPVVIFRTIFSLEYNKNNFFKQINYDFADLYDLSKSQSQIDKMASEKLQKISDQIIEILEFDYKNGTYSYAFDDRIIKLPNDFISANGHDIEKKYLEEFDFLTYYTRGIKTKLILEISKNMFESDLWNYIHDDIVKIFNDIQKNHCPR